MAINTKNRYPADKSGTKYSEFRNTKRVSPGKVVKDVKQSGATSEQTANKSA